MLFLERPFRAAPSGVGAEGGDGGRVRSCEQPSVLREHGGRAVRQPFQVGERDGGLQG